MSVSALILMLMGPTASGKTKLAINLKKYNLINIDIISVDSALVYRGMNIGTAKPAPEELKLAPHSLIDIRDPSEDYSVADFYYDVNYEIEKIIKSGRIPFLVGGTMLYFKVFLEGLFFLPSTNKKIRNDLEYEAQKSGWIYVFNLLNRIDPIAASKIHFNDHKRIIRALEIFFVSGKTWTEWKSTPGKKLEHKIYQFAIIPTNKNILNERIEKRFYKMLEIGLEKEVYTLFNRINLYKTKGNTLPSSMSCIGYRQMWEYLSGKIDYNQMIYKSIYASRRLAKHQLTWLRNWSNLHILNNNCLSAATDSICKVVQKKIV
ncbi:tRNA (adenosine(37)-N6)-dimethylallyltransferase MiaA [Candidatus Blochmannia ocreatus (nom. nud.)]|uniref:tRNA dimethylallyltransferase n=1 Tax=Candidatus Blochmannia ocreatus (nom. nud.) TaxID=251538 RepID=A0ABY4SW40_9ENTR|nr:tRNA (adenosine(37)-N6)-dimethylallyltransferase MiaA [Candidatus Blochmannia ocreatus]URJ25165.1 tRNA (adenosine(37)-N6)-dimethylallyltransferase MiaA [Candidatus Blochmannia ocreatus]